MCFLYECCRPTDPVATYSVQVPGGDPEPVRPVDSINTEVPQVEAAGSPVGCLWLGDRAGRKKRKKQT